MLIDHNPGTEPTDLVATSLDMCNVIALPEIVCVLPVASPDTYQGIAGIREMSKGCLHWQQALALTLT